MVNATIKLKRRPAPAAIIVWGLYIAFAVVWMPRFFGNSSVNIYLEMIFALGGLAALLSRGTLNRRIALLEVAIVLYVAFGYILAVVVRNVHTYDFLLAYKFTWYLALVLPFSRFNVLDGRTLMSLNRFGLILFLAVYALGRATGQFRPTFFIENNFELLFISLLFYASHIANGRTRTSDLLLLIAVGVLSGSRSGIALIAVVAFFSFDMRRLRSVNTIFLVACAVGAVFALFMIFESRSSSGLAGTDRYRFMLHFLNATSSWEWWQFFVGAPRISSLPPDVCSSLSFYQNLMSFRGDGSCYSVILHSFNIRLIYDHGFIVAGAVASMVWILLDNLSWKERTCVLILIFLNGASVSSLNNVYAALGMALLLMVQARGRTIIGTGPQRSSGEK